MFAYEIGKFHLILKQPKRQLLCWKEGQLRLVQVVLFSTVYVRPMPGDWFLQVNKIWIGPKHVSSFNVTFGLDNKHKYKLSIVHLNGT